MNLEDVMQVVRPVRIPAVIADYWEEALREHPEVSANLYALTENFGSMSQGDYLMIEEVRVTGTGPDGYEVHDVTNGGLLLPVPDDF